MKGWRLLALLLVVGALASAVLEAEAQRAGRHRERARERAREREPRGRVRIRKKPKGRECERIKEPLCAAAGLPYNRTRLPNVLGHARQKLAGRALQDYRPLIESGCSPYVRVFLCAAFLPECPRKKRNDPLQPCRGLCEKARADCEPTLNAHGMAWPDELGCETLPERKPNEKREKCMDYEPPRPEEVTTPSSIVSTTTAPSTAAPTTSEPVSPPVIDGFPQGSMIAEGQGATLECHAEGALEYTWSRQDGEMPENKIVSEMVMDGKAILVLHNLTWQDSGHYTCTAENDAGVDEATAKVTVMAVPRITRLSSNVTLTRGEPFELVCQASGSPQPRVTWERKDGKRVLMRRNGTLAILAVESASTSDSGVYFCKAANSLGSAVDIVNVKVLVPPRWDEKPFSRSVAEGDDVTLACRARGSNPMNITWRVEKLKNHSLPSEELPRYSVDEATHALTIGEVEPADREVTFHCDVANEAGALTANAKLKVIEQWQLPKITSTLPNITAFVGEEVSMRCDATGDPVPALRWLLASISVEKLGDERFRVEEGGARLVVSDVNLRDAGGITCVAGNTNGYTTAEGQLDVIEPSLTLTRGLSNTTVANGSVLSLLCTASGQPKPEVLWFFNDQLVNATASPGYLIDGGNLTVRQMGPAYEGKYGCMVNNQFFVRSSIAMVNISRPARKPATEGADVADLNRTQSPNEVAIPPSTSPDMRNASCAPCREPQEPTACDDQPRIKPRRYDITDTGMKGYFRGWVDVTGQGAANDYCRIIMTPTRGLDSSMQLACALAGTAGDSQYNYVSGDHFDIGQMDTWYMRDEDGDGRDDYCRCVSEGPDGQYVYCTRAEAGGFHGAPGVAGGDSQYSFKAQGDRRQLRKCRKRKVDPYFGLSNLQDN